MTLQALLTWSFPKLLLQFKVMFFLGPKVLLLLKRHSLEIYYKNSDKVMEVEFHSSALRHLEVVSRDELIKTLVDAFKSSSLKNQSAVIALSGQIVFEKLIPNEDPVQAQKDALNFYHNIPLDEKNIATKLIPLKGSVLALGVNREFFRIVADVAREFEWKIKAVVPMTLFSRTEEDAKLTPEQVNQVLSADSVFKEADFLEESTLVEEVKTVTKDKESGDGFEEEEDSDPEKKEGPGALVTLLIALFLISLIVASLFYFKILTLPFNISGITPAPSASTIPEATSSARVVPQESTASAQEASVSAQFDRSEIRIHVLNGSGIAGQAGEIKSKLAELGYENVITGNIESSEASSSSVTYSADVEEPVKEELNTFIDSLIGETDKLEETLSEFNVRIILGQLENPVE